MRFAARMWLLGALVPVTGTVAALAVAGHLFRGRLEQSLDRALLTEAATEAVSLFDGPSVIPHLHFDGSPLRHLVDDFAPVAALYAPDGTREVTAASEPALGWTSPRLAPASVPDAPVLHDRTSPDGVPLRVLQVGVMRPGVGRYALELAASRTPITHDVREFYVTGFAMAALLGALLLCLQTVLARRLTRRVVALTQHMGALREGDLDASPPRPHGRDELADLAHVVGAATERLRRTRVAQDRLVGEAAHELRTPLALMRTSIDVALRRRREASELVVALEDTRHEVDRLSHLANRLLELATAGRGEWDRNLGDLRTVAAEACKAARAAAREKGLAVVLAAPTPVLAVFDPHGVRQALDNLLSNAVRHSPPNRAVTLSLHAADGLARLSVHDEGPGIPVADRDRVFEPFEVRERAGGRVGLGLAIVREVARGHSGRAYVDDSERGAKVVLELPAATGALAAAEPTSSRLLSN